MKTVKFKYNTAVDRRMKIWIKLEHGLQKVFGLNKIMPCSLHNLSQSQKRNMAFRFVLNYRFEVQSECWN
jgi:hypothetical protein